ncbi:MAG: type II CRISPR RNA-guided endonuclease Cas9 [Melioribacteraceae bacterium]
MEKILGLDLGTNSIGWAIRKINSQPNQIIAKGVLTFEKGVATTKSGEEPSVKKRTESRGRRRNYQAEKYRKWKLLETLICYEPKMCPLTIDELNEWRKYKKGEGTRYPSSREFKNWLKLDFNNDGIVDFENPYHLRKEASETVIDNPLIVGRAFYNLVQKRGFRGRDEEESKTIIEGSPDLGIAGADVIHKVMQEKDTTLGGALYYENKEGKRIRKRYNIRTDFESELKTICNIQGIDETSELFKNLYKTIIWQRPLRSQKGNIGRCTFEPSKQRCPVSHPLYEEYRAWCFINNIKAKRIEQSENDFDFLSKDQRNHIYEKLFFRKSKPHFDFLDIIKALDPTDSLIFNFEKNATNKHLDITELIKQRKSKNTPYITVSGCPISASLMDIFNCKMEEIKIPHTINDKRNGKKDYYDYEDIWHVLFSFESREKLESFAKEQLKLDDEHIKKFAGVKLQHGYASLSINALKKILVYLHKGFIYSESVFLANLPKVFGRELNDDEIESIIDGLRTQFNHYKRIKEEVSITNALIGDYFNRPIERQIGNYPGYQLINDDYKTADDKIIEFYGTKTWNELPDENKNTIRGIIIREYHNFLQTPKRTGSNLIYKTIPRLDDLIKDYLRNSWNIHEDKFRHLYHPSNIENYLPAKEKDGKKYLGDPMPISRGFKNPMAMKTLHHLKHLINHLLEKGKIDEQTKVVIEIARELNDANRRKAIFFWQKNREEENKKYREEIISAANDANVEVDINNIENIYKYRLWEEQRRVCIYTGKPITFSKLFNGNEVEIEHTIPASISFDNELSNLTVCFKKYNNDIKQKQIPTACPNYNGNITIELSDGAWECGPIKDRIKVWEEKVEHLKKNIESNKKQTKNPSLSKENKDSIIVKRRMWEMDLEYWQKKVNTFTITEFKTAWRNSQLRDTQIVTKYALPYLKTVFEKVDVQKGIITAEFRKIFNVGFEKDRNKQTHHAIDAAILTLIPHASLRDKLLKEHFTANEQNRKFHTAPIQWNDFHPNHLLSLEEEILVNHLTQNRTLTLTKKYVRKRGKIQYVKEKLSDGKCAYKRDEAGNKIPIIAQGDSIRGQLHEESFLGAIKEFEKDENGKPKLENGIAIYKKEKDGSEKLTFVKKILLKDFTSVEDFEKIVDKTVRAVITNEVEKRIENGETFKDAIQENIWMVDENGNPKMIDKKGNPIAPMRHVRCKVTAGRGYLTRDKALEIKEHAMPSKQEHKQFVYAKNDEMSLCLFYEGNVNGKIERAFRLIGLFEMSQYRLKRVTDIANNPEFQFCEVGRGKNKTLIPLSSVITTGTHVLIYKESSDELRELNNKELLKRLYRVYKFNEAPSAYIYLQHHLEARPDGELGVGETGIELAKYQARLKLVANNFNCLLEEKHFTITLDGEIVLKQQTNF